ncbi:hypothetical protein F2Q68_00021552 [Brassica cretica]|uniref:Uncharacterized protein n=1 Tax=Brassica cretica TaxID=69181 RepID=A0A8S9FUK5_BRACR|nr:hypothetical protein F2Q68_00021552 [Brassica cretica]
MSYSTTSTEFSLYVSLGFPRRPPSLESPAAYYLSNTPVLTMTIPQVLSGDLKAGRCRKTVVTRVLRFWEARNVKKGGGGNHRSDDMPGAGLVSTNPSDRMIRDASDKTTAE